jgi:hypothetical protein
MKGLKIHQLCLIMVSMVIFTNTATAQHKSYKLNADRDTINIVSAKGLKEGRWVNKVEELRGEPGYEEEGVFLNGNKEGYWRKYTLQGDLIAVERFKRGGKDGLQQYYSFVGDPIRDENWRGYDPEHPYDTVAVYGTGSNEIVALRVVKAEQYSVKEGEWRYYEGGMIVKTEQWERNNLVTGKKDTAPVASSNEKRIIEKTPEMLEWERKNKGKKGVVRDGKTGM